MRSIVWLQISDFHLREGQEWAQDVVLSEMCRDIVTRRPVDFILATGDLAFSGKAAEYELSRAFFDEVMRVSGVHRERIFFIPGNHDVDRSQQKLAFTGARHTLRSQNEVDVLLGSPEDSMALRERQASYYRFQEEYLGGQDREWTPDGLGYVSTITIEDLRIAIVGFNSAWLAEGGVEDHGKLLIGERQVIDALGIANGKDAHLIIGMGHHPLHLLNEFDYRPVQRRITENCQFYHCGHLHDPEAYGAGRTDTQCLTVAAGASFESRHAHNAYSLISLDVMQAQSTVTTIQYRPTDGAFSYVWNRTFPLNIRSSSSYKLCELGVAIEAAYPAIAPVSHLLAALLLEMQTEVPIVAAGSCAFGSVEVLRDQLGAALRTETLEFLALRNPLRMFSRHMSPDEFLARYGSELATYGSALVALSSDESGLKERIAAREADARALAGTEPVRPFTHTLALFRTLADEQDWDLLREQTERHIDAADGDVATEARRMLALALANSDEAEDRARAVRIYQEMVSDGSAAAEDLAALVSVFAGAGRYEPAKATLLDGLQRFPGAAERFMSLAHAIIEATGDRDFRDMLRARQEERGEK